MTLAEAEAQISEQHKAFAVHYLKNFDITEACAASGYSSQSNIGYRILQDPAIRVFLKHMVDRRLARVALEGEQILRELVAVGTSDVRNLLDEDNCVLPPSDWPDALGKAVSYIEVEEIYQGRGEAREYVGRVKKIKLWDKIKSLELLGKNLALWVDRVEHSGSVKLEDLITASIAQPAPAIPECTLPDIETRAESVEDLF